MTSTKDGCSPSGQCGCCTVLVDGKAVVSCTQPVDKVAGKAVTTLEGTGADERQRFADAFSACGGASVQSGVGRPATASAGTASMRCSSSSASPASAVARCVATRSACAGDGDAVAHAVADALLGAAGFGDLGEQFPDTDPSFEGADSVELLRRVVASVAADGWRIGNADCSVVCESPKLAPMRQQMQQRLGEAVGAPVSVKGSRAEGLGAIGRGEGVVCFAAVVILRGEA